MPTSVRAVCRRAIEGADAFRATRAAVQVNGETLRIGNRFVRADRYREIAFLALGNAAVSQALAVTGRLGERLTQGFVAGPVPAPREVPFRDIVVPDLLPGSAEGMEAARAAVELVSGLGTRDLLLLLLSPGALGCLALPPAGWDPYVYREFLAELRKAGASGEDATLAVRVLSEGGVGGGLLGSLPGGEVVPLVIERGEGGASVGGGPTIPVGDAERERLRGRLDALGMLPRWGSRLTFPPPAHPAPPVAARSERPVVVASPGDALEGAGAAAAERKWAVELGALNLEGGPAECAEAFLAAVERAVAERGGVAARRGSPGLALFAATRLGTVEGVGDRDEVELFLRTASLHLKRRNTTVLLFRTAGTPPGSSAPPGGVVDASGPVRLDGKDAAELLPTAPGVTDVGAIVVAFVRPEGP